MHPNYTALLEAESHLLAYALNSPRWDMRTTSPEYVANYYNNAMRCVTEVVMYFDACYPNDKTSHRRVNVIKLRKRFERMYHKYNNIYMRNASARYTTESL